MQFTEEFAHRSDAIHQLAMQSLFRTARQFVRGRDCGGRGCESRLDQRKYAHILKLSSAEDELGGKLKRSFPTVCRVRLPRPANPSCLTSWSSGRGPVSPVLNEHVRTDVLSEKWSFETRAWIEFYGIAAVPHPASGGDAHLLGAVHRLFLFHRGNLRSARRTAVSLGDQVDFAHRVCADSGCDGVPSVARPRLPVRLIEE